MQRMQKCLTRKVGNAIRDKILHAVLESLKHVVFWKLALEMESTEKVIVGKAIMLGTTTSLMIAIE